MSVQTASVFFATLALLTLGAVVLVTLAAVTREAVPSLRSSLATARSDLGRASLGLAWLVATVATLGSLYYSEIAGFTPCQLCWYQRICMYPLAVILGIAALRRDRSVRFYVLPIALVGAGIAAYHAWIQAFPPQDGTMFCTADVPCTDRFVWEFGFVSLPFMALSGFSFIVTMMLLARPERVAPATDEGDRSSERAGDGRQDAERTHEDPDRDDSSVQLAESAP
jgi:disulfide bond formation protein DsbB